jgi:hypothetical protein
VGLSGIDVIVVDVNHPADHPFEKTLGQNLIHSAGEEFRRHSSGERRHGWKPRGRSCPDARPFFTPMYPIALGAMHGHEWAGAACGPEYRKERKKRPGSVLRRK